MFLFVAIFATVILLPSCASKSTYSTVKTLGIQDYGVISKPVLADLNVSETKVTGFAVGIKGNSYEALKNEAIKNAIDAVGADVLVEPQFTVDVTGNSVKITVKGYPGKYENFKSVEPNEINIKQGNVQVVKPQPVTEEPKKKGGNFWGTFWAVLGGIALTTVVAVGASS
ncbi:MAG: hypothetical protein LBR34_11075 [Prevotella sp.]|jgi:hypothetical protein|nr:hypothetical protein [Prevotella sp.]